MGIRVIQDGECERLGSPRTIKVDVRIIAATNRNLADEVKNGTFREDLYCESVNRTITPTTILHI